MNNDLAYFNNGEKKKLPNKKKKKKMKEESEESVAESSEEELDLTKECHPIAHYMSDRAEMIAQMFSVIKGNKLRTMLPPILKDADIEQLKLECLDELLGMSEKRITSIIEGEILDSSSESDVSMEDEDSDKSELSSSPNNQRDEGSSRKYKRNKRKSDTEHASTSNKAPRTEEERAPEQGKTLLEILELEMRARAIRALLNQGGETSQEDIKTDHQQSGDIVDLTEEDEDEFPTIIKKEPHSLEQERTFESIVEKTAGKNKHVGEADKKMKLLAELELRNRLIKKKSYRTKQQRMENVEEDHVRDDQEVQKARIENLPQDGTEKVVTEIVIEDPEDGEVTSDDEPLEPVIKIEKPDSPTPEELPRSPTGERITAIDEGNFVVNTNLKMQDDTISDGDESSVEQIEIKQKEVEEFVVDGDEAEEEKSVLVPETGGETVNDNENLCNESAERLGNQENDETEDTTWRDRWLQRKDIQNVVISSKICGKAMKSIAKKRRRDAQKADENETVENMPETLSPIVIGSVTEYETLQNVNESENSEEAVADVEKVIESAIVEPS